MSSADWSLAPQAHAQVFAEKVLPHSGLDSTTPQEHPKAIVLAGQPGAGKSGVAGAAIRELAGDAIALCLHQARALHQPHNIGSPEDSPRPDAKAGALAGKLCGWR